MKHISNGALLMALVAFSSAQMSFAAEEAAEVGHTISLGEGKVNLTAPKDWEEKEPKFKNIVVAEFAVKPADGDKAGGRVTLGGLGGGTEPNIQRWISQYSNAETERDELEVADQEVLTISVRGTYKGSRFRKEPTGPGYRLLAAVIQTEAAGVYYVKFYGPEKTVDENEEAFAEMLQSLQVK